MNPQLSRDVIQDIENICPCCGSILLSAWMMVIQRCLQSLLILWPPFCFPIHTWIGYWLTAPRQILTIEAKRVCPALHTGCRSLPLATVAAELVGTSSWKGMYLYLFPSLNCSHSISGKNVRRIGRSDQDAGKPSCPAVSAADISACSEEDTRRCISFISHLFSCTRGASTTRDGVL